MRFDYTIVHAPGKSLCTADALSRSPFEMNSYSDSNFQQEVDAYVNLIITLYKCTASSNTSKLSYTLGFNLCVIMDDTTVNR